jgi:two-component system sensor histidine kinase/response regulator
MTKILVIEDTDALRAEIVDILGFEGYGVHQAENGRIGVELARRERPDLILCDVMMPEMDGFATLAAIRADPALATTPFVFLTARSERGDMRQAMEGGADDYITKPFAADELIAGITAGLAKRRRNAVESEAKVTALRDQLSDVLPHEIRTPLNVILGFAELLADTRDPRVPPEVVDIGRSILEAAGRLHRMTENVLLFAQLRVLAGRESATAAVPCLEARIVADVVREAARQKAKEHGRDADLGLDVTPGAVRITDDYLQKVVGELVDNACKFSKPGTPVRVRLVPDAQVMRLAIGDEGSGMTPDQIEAVGGFIQFERGAREQQGIGLGLSIVQRIVTLWGGTLSIESRPGGSTIVTVTLGATSPATDAADVRAAD